MRPELPRLSTLVKDWGRPLLVTQAPWKSGGFAEVAVSKSAGFDQLLNSPEKYFLGDATRRRKPLAHRRLPRLDAASGQAADLGATKEFLKIRIAHRSNSIYGEMLP